MIGQNKPYGSVFTSGLFATWFISVTVYQTPNSNWTSPDVTLTLGPRFRGRSRRCALASNCFTKSSAAAGRPVRVESRIRS